jgi:D-xylonolactonase
MQLEMIANYACVCGEGPLWHPTEKRLYWTDIETGRLFWYEPATGKHQQCYSGPRVGGFTFQANGSLLLFRDKGNIVEWRDGRETRTIIKDLPDEVEGRFNDVIADPMGRVFCGTLSDVGKPGRLYRLDTDGSITVLVEGLGCPNGMGFTKDLKTMYFTDSASRTIWQFDYNRETGAISNQRQFILVPTADGQGVPDGMTIDADGNIWSARWDGSCVVQYDPKGKELQRIKIPTMKCSSVTFAGDDNADMYLTTAGGDNPKANGETAGALYRVRGVTKGRPEFVSRL